MFIIDTQIYWWTFHQVRYQDLLREAEMERLVQQALKGRESHHNLGRRVMVWLGCRLVAWGERLQGRYSTTTNTLGFYEHQHC